MKAAESRAWSTDLRAQASSLGLGPTLPVRQASPAPQAQWLQPTPRQRLRMDVKRPQEAGEPPGQALDNHTGPPAITSLCTGSCLELDPKPCPCHLDLLIYSLSVCY